jgi:hypothetical protein
MQRETEWLRCTSVDPVSHGGSEYAGRDCRQVLKRRDSLDSGAGEASGENGSYGSSRQDVMRCDVLYSCSGLGFFSRPI